VRRARARAEPEMATLLAPEEGEAAAGAMEAEALADLLDALDPDALAAAERGPEEGATAAAPSI
jgi:hypothetical protein